MDAMRDSAWHPHQPTAWTGLTMLLGVMVLVTPAWRAEARRFGGRQHLQFVDGRGSSIATDRCASRCAARSADSFSMASLLGSHAFKRMTKSCLVGALNQQMIRAASARGECLSRLSYTRGKDIRYRTRLIKRLPHPANALRRGDDPIRVERRTVEWKAVSGPYKGSRGLANILVTLPGNGHNARLRDTFKTELVTDMAGNKLYDYYRDFKSLTTECWNGVSYVSGAWGENGMVVVRDYNKHPLPKPEPRRRGFLHRLLGGIGL